MTLTGIPIEPLDPGSPEWLRKMSASKVAAVLGLSPYDSRFSLYFRMRDGIKLEDNFDELRRGHYLEPSIAAWFADQHPAWGISPGGCWQHSDADWYTASPDRLISTEDPDVICGLEVKSEADGDGWGEEHTDQVPVEVRAQVMSQMDIVGTRRTYVAVLLPYLEFRQYVIDYNEAEAKLIRDECAKFMADLANDVVPNIDDHAATYQMIRALHPDIDQADVELDYDTAREFCEASRAYKAAEAAWQYQRSVMADLLGSARRGRYLDHTIATRQAKGEGRPFLVVGRSLPAFTTDTQPQGVPA